MRKTIKVYRRYYDENTKLLKKYFIRPVHGQIISIVYGICCSRTVFIFTLGIEYLGVDGLFTEYTIDVFPSNCLGFDTAIIY